MLDPKTYYITAIFRFDVLGICSIFTCWKFRMIAGDCWFFFFLLSVHFLPLTQVVSLVSANAKGFVFFSGAVETVFNDLYRVSLISSRMKSEIYF